MIVRGLITLALLLALTGVANALTLSVPGISELALLPSSGTAQSCGGQNLSPPLAWSDVPAGVKSFALVFFDEDVGAGRAQWVVYGIPADVTSIPAGYTGGVKGLNTDGHAVFEGYGFGLPSCPYAPGVPPHHYVYVLFATDLAPNALAPGLTRDGLWYALTGHIIKGPPTRFVGIYGR